MYIEASTSSASILQSTPEISGGCALSSDVDDLQQSVSPQFTRLAGHNLYANLSSMNALRVFMAHHVFAVWDFMSLLKALQRHLTCVDAMWRPTANATGRRLINEMVLEEESDEFDGAATSHFEVYLQAMREAGADLGPISRFLDALATNLSLEASLEVAGVPAAAREFVRTTFALIGTDRPAAVCAAFTLGREQAIPDVFGALLANLPEGSTDLPTLRRYLQRHIELDGQDHGPKALAVLATICGDDAGKWADAKAAARCALDARIALWSGIDDAITEACVAAPRRAVVERPDGEIMSSRPALLAPAMERGRHGERARGHVGA